MQYTTERGQQILISLLKAHGIKRIIASPGTTNLTFVASLQQDPFFKIYSSVDERSAAYMACGIAAETGEPVVITCTGATASRNYMPGMTEAYYSKLPVLAVTANSGIDKRGHLIAQQLDRSRVPVDVANVSVDIPVIKDDTDAWLANVNINKAILALSHGGGGPAHINISTTYSRDYSVEQLPAQRVISRITPDDMFPSLEGKKTAIFIGSHRDFSESETRAIEEFCETFDAVVFTDHTGGYYGKYRMIYSSVMMQKAHTDTRQMDVLIHLGEVSGDYPSLGVRPTEVWRVNPDGEIRDTFHCLRHIFEMPEECFFRRMTSGKEKTSLNYFEQCKAEYDKLHAILPEFPFGNIWTAAILSKEIPAGAELHLGILNTLRSWNLFDLPKDIHTYCNVGGFGIDGIMSTALGASLVNPDKLYFCILGDLAFFYDLNSIANRHLGNNLRVMLINNGRGTEFTNYGHPGHDFGEAADPFIAAAGHYGNKSAQLVKDYACDLGFTYLKASSKEEFLSVYKQFVSPGPTEKPILFEVFTDSSCESDALELMSNLLTPPLSAKQQVKNSIKQAIGPTALSAIKKIIR